MEPGPLEEDPDRNSRKAFSLAILNKILPTLKLSVHIYACAPTLYVGAFSIHLSMSLDKIWN